jgi:hypothetical protein
MSSHTLQISLLRAVSGDNICVRCIGNVLKRSLKFQVILINVQQTYKRLYYRIYIPYVCCGCFRYVIYLGSQPIWYCMKSNLYFYNSVATVFNDFQNLTSTFHCIVPFNETVDVRDGDGLSALGSTP